MLIAVTLTAVLVASPAPLRMMVFLDVVFLLPRRTQLAWPPAVTNVLVCLLPLAALLAGDRVGRTRPCEHLAGAPTQAVLFGAVRWAGFSSIHVSGDVVIGGLAVLLLQLPRTGWARC